MLVSLGTSTYQLMPPKVKLSRKCLVNIYLHKLNSAIVGAARKHSGKSRFCIIPLDAIEYALQYVSIA